MEQLIELDRSLFLGLNGLHHPLLDQVMFVLTNTAVWVPMYALLLYWIYKKYGRASWIFIIAIAVTVTLTDQITSSIMKPYFLRFRPSHEPALAGLVHTVNGYKGGTYGFASSHAANTAGVAMIIFLMLRERHRLWWLFVWAVFVSYTRIYLGVHYPGDIIVGAMVGLACGWICFRLANSAYLRMQASG